MGSSVPGGWRGSACSGGEGGGGGGGDDARSIDLGGGRAKGPGGGEGGRGEARAHPELLERVRLPRGFPQQRREIDAVAFGLQVRQHARRLLHLLGRCEGGGAAGGVRRARQSARAGAICKTNARDDRGDGATFRADPRGAAPGDRSTRRATARSRTRRDRGPRASPSAARGARIGVPRGGKKTKKLRALFSRASGTHDCRHRRRPARRGRGRRTRRPRAAWACRTSRAGSRAPRRSTARALDAQ